MSMNDPTMEAEKQHRTFNSAMTLDEVSMERSKSFVNAVQELKNLRPQLHSAAEYCERSYIHSEQKQMVLNNLKDYTIQALVNAVDHLGTVSYKLTDVLEQQTLDISTMDLKVSCMNQFVEDQKLMACQTYTVVEGIRRQKLLAFIPRHHKHYILPNSVNKKTDASFQAKPSPQSLGSEAAKTLSWHLASETTSTPKRNTHGLSSEDPQTSNKLSSDAFHLLQDKEEETWKKSVASPAPQSRGDVLSNLSMQSIGVPLRERFAESPNAKALTAFRSFDNPRLEIGRATPVCSKSMLSAFFVKHKTYKL